MTQTRLGETYITKETEEVHAGNMLTFSIATWHLLNVICGSDDSFKGAFYLRSFTPVFFPDACVIVV